MFFLYMISFLYRTAQVPCVIIPGFAKSMSYQVGDDVDKVRALSNYWNAVYVEEEWRLVFPLWAYRNVAIKGLFLSININFNDFFSELNFGKVQHKILKTQHQCISIFQHTCISYKKDTKYLL